MERIKMRTYGVLADNGEILYLYENYEDIDLEDYELDLNDAVIRIDSYVVLAQGPRLSWNRAE